MNERPAAPDLRVIHGRRGVATLVTVRATELADLQDELTALRAEAGERYARLLEATRSVQRHLDDIERDLVRGLNQLGCPACESRLLREAFGPQSWHDRARVGELPAMVVGGVPVTTSSGAVPGGVSPHAVPQSGA